MAIGQRGENARSRVAWEGKQGTGRVVKAVLVQISILLHVKIHHVQVCIAQLSYVELVRLL